MKKINDFLKVSAPIQIYLLLLFISIIFIAAANYTSDGIIIDVSTLNLSKVPPDGIIKIAGGNAWNSIIANLGYGIFCSTIVAFLVDLGATYRQIENDKKEFDDVTKVLKNSISSLFQIRNTYDQVYKEAKALSEICFIDWLRAHIIRCLLSDRNANPSSFKVVDILFSYFSAILAFAKDVRYKSALLADNHSVPDDFFTSLDSLIHYLEFIVNTKDKAGAQWLGVLLDHVLNLVFTLFPEFKSVFNEEWDSEKMIQKYGPDLSNLVNNNYNLDEMITFDNNSKS